ncbi:diguanylate cyclase [Sulfurimonas aquatica]|uniref:diguanylate cyclase n=1 Tax=Sulfurimonas aquatica TaxID=2672570 RepID=A0A975GBG6_9BACT|nr:diguanylate cyclase [Sulfurimonas aquatica]QSZ40641.1 diguanylate cyclase [Sulfurimonas aquatica]
MPKELSKSQSTQPNHDEQVKIFSDHCYEVKHVLVIEDSSTLSQFMQKSIQEKFSIICDVAATEQEARELIQSKKYDLLFVDIYLPDSSGNFIGWLIRRKERLFIITSSENDKEREKLIKLPIVDYMYKSDKDTVIKYINNTLSRLMANRTSLALICDDSSISRRVLSDMLKTQNIPYAQFANGKEAHESIVEHNINADILISDFEMPLMNGLDLTRLLRLKYDKFELPILILSGSSNPALIANILKFGANDYIFKEFSMEELLTRMNTLLDHSRLFKENTLLLQKLESAAMTDCLTTMYNRNYFHANVTHVVASAKRENQPYSILLFDIDYFKKVNDTYGHDAGDTVLQIIAQEILSNSREADIACRWGGEEFLILAPHCSLADAVIKAENIRKNIESLSIKLNETTSIKITTSIGVSSGIETSAEDLIKTADSYLYIAKERGRNCVISSEND